MSRSGLRVAILAPHFAEYSTRLAIAMSAHCPTLLLADRDNRANECDPALLSAGNNNLSVQEYGSHTRFDRRLSILLVVLRILVFRPTIIHVQEQGDVLTALFVRILRTFYKILLTVHDPKPHSGNDASYARRKDPYLKLLRESAAAYHVHGPFCRDLLIEVSGAVKPIVSTAHGALMMPSSPVCPPPEKGRMLIFGRMEAYKGLEDFLEAAKILRARQVLFHLVIAGRGPELDRLADETRGRDDVTIISKYLTPLEAASEFQRASFVVAPYRDATQSGVVAAAFGNGRPVVATNAGGLADAIRAGVDGLTVPPCASGELAAAIELILTDDGLLARLSAGAVESRETAFNWATIAQTLVVAYGDLGAGRGPIAPRPLTVRAL